jgi:hypothetical protein
MRESEYRFIMDSYTDTESLKEISDIYSDTKYRTRIEGEDYCLSERAYDEYMMYRNTGRQQCIYLSDSTGIPYPLVYDAVCRQRDFAGVMDKIYVKSLFEEKVNAAVREALKVVPDAFSQVKRLTDGTRTLNVGDLVLSDNANQVVYTDKCVYVTANKEKCFIAEKYKLNMDSGEIARRDIYSGGSISDMYAAVVKDCLNEYKLKSNPGMLSRTAKIMGLTCFSDLNRTVDKVMGKGR